MTFVTQKRLVLKLPFIRESVTSVLAQNIVICKKTIRILYVAEEGKSFAMIGEDLTPQLRITVKICE